MTIWESNAFGFTWLECLSCIVCLSLKISTKEGLFHIWYGSTVYTVSQVLRNNNMNPLLHNITSFDAFEIYHVFENIMENGAFALLEQILHFP